jgi:hypothetical protein
MVGEADHPGAAGGETVPVSTAQVLARLEAAAADPAGLTAATAREVQDVLAAATRAYAAMRAAGAGLPAFASGSRTQPPSATDVVVTISEMLESAGIELFEVGLWQTMGSTGAPPVARPEARS